MLLSIFAFWPPPFIYNPSPDYAVYLWGAEPLGYPGSPDVLTWQAQKAAQLKVKTLRLEMGFNQDQAYGFDPAPIPGESDYLVRVASTPPYAALFDNPAFDTFLLTTYTPAAYGHAWLTDDADLGLEYLEYFNLARHLSQRHPGKRFILLNWEGDNELNGHLDREEAFRKWLSMRVTGVRDAGAANVFSAIEFNYARGNEARVARMLPALKPDVASYSYWKSIERFFSSGTVEEYEAALNADLDYLPTLTGNEYTGEELIIGEFGREAKPDGVAGPAISARDWFQASHRVFRRHGIKYAVCWQLVDDGTKGYGLYGPDGALTENGRAFVGMLPMKWKWFRRWK